MKVHHDQGAEAQHHEDYAKKVTTNHQPTTNPPPSPTNVAQIRQSTQVSDICVSFVMFISAASGWLRFGVPESSEEGVFIFILFGLAQL